MDETKNKQMDEQANETKTPATEEKKKDAKPKRKDTDKKTLADRFNDYKGEFRKITWPSKQDLYKQTVVVVVISLIVGALIFGMDTILELGSRWFTDLFN